MFPLWVTVQAIAASSTVTVEVADGGLINTAIILQARTGAIITYEGVPRNIAGLHYVARVLRSGNRAHDKIGDGELIFSYSADASALEAVEAAVAVANSDPKAYAKYKAVEQDGAINIVPTDILTETGWVSYQPLLDTVVTLPSATGTPTELYRATIAALGQAAGVPVYDLDGRALEPWMSPTITLPSATAPVRVLLDQIVGEAVYVNNWRLTYKFPEENPDHGWRLAVSIVQPEDDNLMNRTPLVPVAPKPTSADPNTEWWKPK